MLSRVLRSVLSLVLIGALLVSSSSAEGWTSLAVSGNTHSSASFSTQALMLRVASIPSGTSSTIRVWAWAGKLAAKRSIKKVVYGSIWSVARHEPRPSAALSLVGIVLFTSAMFAFVFAALLWAGDFTWLFSPVQKHQLLVHLGLGAAGLGTGSMALFHTGMFLMTFEPYLSVAKTPELREELLDQIFREMKEVLLQYVPGTAFYDERLRERRIARAREIRGLRSTLASSSVPLAQRIDAAKRLMKRKAFIPESLQKDFKRLPTLGSRQAMMWATWLYYNGQLSLEELRGELSTLARWEKEARDARGRSHLIGLEVHSAIPQFIDTPFHPDELDAIALAKWLDDPMHSKKLHDIFVQEQNYYDRPQAAVATLNRMISDKILAPSLAVFKLDEFPDVLRYMWSQRDHEHSIAKWTALNRYALHAMEPSIFPSALNPRGHTLQDLFQTLIDVPGNRTLEGDLRVSTVFEEGGLEFQSLPSSSWKVQDRQWLYWEKVSIREKFSLIDLPEAEEKATWMHLNFNGAIKGSEIQMILQLALFSSIRHLRQWMGPKKIFSRPAEWEIRPPRKSKFGGYRTEVMLTFWASPGADGFEFYRANLLSRIDTAVWSFKNKKRNANARFLWTLIKSGLPDPISANKRFYYLSDMMLYLFSLVIGSLETVQPGLERGDISWDAFEIFTRMVYTMEEANIQHLKGKESDRMPENMANRLRGGAKALRRQLEYRHLFVGFYAEAWTAFNTALEKELDGTAEYETSILKIGASWLNGFVGDKSYVDFAAILAVSSFSVHWWNSSRYHATALLSEAA